MAATALQFMSAVAPKVARYRPRELCIAAGQYSRPIGLVSRRRASLFRRASHSFVTVLRGSTTAGASKPVRQAMIRIRGRSRSIGKFGNFQVDEPLLGTRSDRIIETFTRVVVFGTPKLY